MGDSNKYTIGWVCAIKTEYVAAKAFLDKEHESLECGSTNDNNIYTLGEMGKHNVVITQLPKNEYGIAAAASVARDLVHTFPNIRIGLMVGVGGGAPSKKHDIRLGDVVVSAPHNGKGGVFQYDFGKTIQDQAFRTTGFLDQPPGLLRAAMGDIDAEYEMEGHQLEEAISNVLERWPKLRKKYKRPDPSSDRLYQTHIIHSSEEMSCEAVCGDDESKLIVRSERSDEDDNPAIHYGLIASANQLMKDAVIRDRLITEKDVLCFEMEAAGLMNHFPCLVVRGICDYSDSHKNKEWQGYAAMAAAAYAKDLLSRILPNKVEVEKRISDILSSVQTYVEETRDNSRVLVSEQRREKVIAKLPYAKGSTFDSSDGEIDPKCHPETRIDLLCQIKEWADDQQGKCIFWLNGMAGTGKSTISRTVATSFRDERKLGASFFFKRGEGDRGNATMFFTTICAQLLVKLPELIPFVEKAIDADPYISDKPLKEKFEKLIYHPLSMVQDISTQVCELVIVIDALDECEHERDVKTILQLLSETKKEGSVKLRVFVTSRPELPIRLGFKNIPKDTFQDLVLHEIPRPTIEHDISVFLKAELRRISQDNGLSMDWPGETRIQTLVMKATPLFIFAATICRFIEDRTWNPEERLVTILRYEQTTKTTKLGGIYLPILEQMLVKIDDKSERETLVQEFRKIVGSIIILQDPLSVRSLAHLLDFSEDTISRRLDPLHSVLSIPINQDSPVRLLHLSFRDFLVGAQIRGNTPFHVHETEAHKMMMMKCLKRMSRPGCLRENICGLENHGTLRTEIDSRIITNCLPPDMQYACRFWVSHLDQSKSCICDNDPVYVFLQDHFLYWLESLSLLGRISESISLIHRLQTLVNNRDMEISKFLDDAMRFVRKYSLIIDRAPLQLYSSALIFTPKRSIIRSIFISKIPSWIQRLPEVESAWSAVLQTLEGHSGWVNAVAFSPDVKLVASGSDDETVKLWDPATGTLQQTLEGHSGWVGAVAFSPDGKLVASGSRDKTVKLWDPATGTLQQTLEGHSDSVHAVAFSPDGKLVASGSRDETVKLWDPATSTLQQTLEGHSGWVHAVAFSPDGKLVASGSDDETVKLWDPATGTLQQTLEGHSDSVGAVAFSPDGKFLETDRGRFNIESLCISPTASSLFNNMLVKNEWVARNDTNVIWLPVEYRATCSAVYESLLVLGHASGRVTFLKLI